MPMTGAAAIIQKHPYLHYNEQRALESIVRDVIPRYPVVRTMLLYGSKARGNFAEESDIDLLFVTDDVLTRAKKNEISDAIFEIEVEHEVVVSAIFAGARDFEAAGSSFLKRVHNEGIVLWSRE